MHARKCCSCCHRLHGRESSLCHRRFDTVYLGDAIRVAKDIRGERPSLMLCTVPLEQRKAANAQQQLQLAERPPACR